MKHQLRDHIRDGGYEVLCFVGGYLAYAVHPTQRNAEQILKWFHETRGRQENLLRLQKRGLVEADAGKTEGVLRLTELGRTALDGGRQPEEAWARKWDGDFRVLMFDLPHDSGPARLRFWRWLRANHVGKLQGSVWITPDPIPGIEQVMAESGLDPSTLTVIVGGVAGPQTPQQLAAAAWDFPSINAGYRQYTGFAQRILRQVGKKTPSPTRLVEIVRQDRKQWWSAVRADPLLPKSLLPKTYEGPQAWKERQKLHKILVRNLDLEPRP